MGSRGPNPGSDHHLMESNRSMVSHTVSDWTMVSSQRLMFLTSSASSTPLQDDMLHLAGTTHTP